MIMSRDYWILDNTVIMEDNGVICHTLEYSNGLIYCHAITICMYASKHEYCLKIIIPIIQFVAESVFNSPIQFDDKRILAVRYPFQLYLLGADMK